MHIGSEDRETPFARRVAALSMGVAALIAAGCGGSAGTPGSPGPATSPVACTVTLSGAVSKTLSCSAVALAWDSTKNLTAFGFSAGTSSTGAPEIQVAVSVPGQPATAVYRSSDASAKGAITIQEGSGVAMSVWAAAEGGSTPAAGSYALTLTSLGTSVAASGGKVWTPVHGTLDATLAPLTGQAGTVTVHAAF